MQFFNWSKGCLYLRSYVNIVPVDPENDVLQSHRGPVDSNPAISPEVRVVAPPVSVTASVGRETAFSDART